MYSPKRYTNYPISILLWMIIGMSQKQGKCYVLSEVPKNGTKVTKNGNDIPEDAML